MTVFEILSLAVPAITAVVVGLVGIWAVRRDKRRDDEKRREDDEKRREDKRRDEERALLADQLKSMHKDIKHVDECVDDLKERVLGNTVTKADLAAHEVDVRATISDVSNRVGNDTKGLHDRVFRVEDYMLKMASAK